MNNLNMHKLFSTYEAYEPHQSTSHSRATGNPSQLEAGRWLNITKVEVGRMTRHCLNRRASAQETLKRKIKIIKGGRNNQVAQVDWCFTTEDAREKMKILSSLLYNLNVKLITDSY
jgi:hypothetical protein